MPALLLEWEFTPVDFFEERVELRSGPYLKHLRSLRDATAQELAEAREIGRAMIEAYLQHLKSTA